MDARSVPDEAHRLGPLHVPVEFFALQDEIVEFTDFVVKRECGEFLRAVLDGNT